MRKSAARAPPGFLFWQQSRFEHVISQFTTRMINWSHSEQKTALVSHKCLSLKDYLFHRDFEISIK